MLPSFATQTVRSPAPIRLDPAQLRVLELEPDISASVLGDPGTGKTTTIIELVAKRIAATAAPEQFLVLTPSRVAATRLRDVLARRIGVPTSGPLARTAASLAHEIVGVAARSAGKPPPRLLTGADIDADIAAYLAGHITDGTGPDWPAPLTPEVRRLAGFRGELREFIARATEYRVSPDRVRELARISGVTQWWAVADFLAEYQRLQALHRPEQFDSAELVSFAVQALSEGNALDRVANLRLVLVDDFQDVTESTLALVGALRERGVSIIAFGNPDVASNSFRGGEADALARFAERVGGLGAHQRLVLDRVYRGNPKLREFFSRVVERIGTATAGSQRRASLNIDSVELDSARPPLARVSALSRGASLAAIARVLREEHLLHQVPWSAMAVVVRSGEEIPRLVRDLARAEVPARSAGRGKPLREELAPRALLTLVEVGIGRRELDPETATELLLGPYGGLDPISFRRLCQELRHEELSGGGNRSGVQLLAEALALPSSFVTLASAGANQAARVAKTLSLLHAHKDKASIEDLLWIAWENSNTAKRWQKIALGDTAESAEANRNLDAVVALFTAATRYVEQRPHEAPLDFLAHVLDSPLADDLLTPESLAQAVTVATPAALSGLEFRTVIITGLQDGAWPNLRPRGSLLAPERFVRLVEGLDVPGIDERKIVLDDELRLFALALSRASERVILAAVDSEDETPSVFFTLAADAVSLDSRVPLTLRGLVGFLRRELTSANTPAKRMDEAAATLAYLAERGVPGADPGHWLGIREPSSDAPLFADREVTISPSQIESVEDSALDWVISRLAPRSSSAESNIGTLLHWVLETATDKDAQSLWSQIEQRLPELRFEANWVKSFRFRATKSLVHSLAEYLRDFTQGEKILLSAERRFRFPVFTGVILSGSIDRVELNPDNSVVIVDLKTGRVETSAERLATHPQLAAYQLAYREGQLDDLFSDKTQHHPGGAKLLFIKEGVRGKLYREGFQLTLDDAALALFRDRLREVAEAMAAQSFTGPAKLKFFDSRPVSDFLLPRIPEVTHG